MIKCDTMKLNPRGHVVAEGGPLQILSEAKLLFCELINREAFSRCGALRSRGGYRGMQARQQRAQLFRILRRL